MSHSYTNSDHGMNYVDRLVVLHSVVRFAGRHVVVVQFAGDHLAAKYFWQLQLLEGVGNGGLHQ